MSENINQVYLYPTIQLIPEFDLEKTIDGQKIINTDIFDKFHSTYQIYYGFTLRDGYGNVVIDDLSKGQYWELIHLEPSEFIEFVGVYAMNNMQYQEEIEDILRFARNKDFINVNGIIYKISGL